MTQPNVNTPWFLFDKNRILLHKSTDDRLEIPVGLTAPFPCDTPLDVIYPDHIDGLAAHLSAPVEEPDHWTLLDLRQSYYVLSETDYLRAGKASQILYWNEHSRYCPACGTPTEMTTPITKRCPRCGYEIYPTIATAIIVLIRKEDRVLLVHARNFRSNFHGLVAGFLEAGETLEECVRREVREETALEITDLRYFDNQPWPYPSGLMVGFTARYLSGEIKVQQEELTDAAFYSLSELPTIPGKMSMARRLIDSWIDSQQKR